jgi:hypothetical protein
MIYRKKNIHLNLILGTTNILTITIDESFENIRSGPTGIIISLPKQKHLSYLLKFSNQEGKGTFFFTHFEFAFFKYQKVY